MPKLKETAQLSKRIVATGPGIAADVTSRYTDRVGDRWLIHVEVKTVKGRAEITKLVIEPQGASTAITRRLLRDLPIGKIFQSALEERPNNLIPRMRVDNSSVLHQGRKHERRELEEVARIYRDAHRARRPVQRAVALTLGISISGAAKRIMSARRLGLLPPIGSRR